MECQDEYHFEKGKNIRRFIFSEVPEEEQESLRRGIKELGGVVESTAKNIFSPQCTHIIVKVFTFTEKVMSGLAGGKWLVSPAYLTVSIQQGHWADEAKYELPYLGEMAKSCRLRFAIAKRGIYADQAIYVKLKNTLIMESFRRILAVGSAEVLSTSMAWKANIAISDAVTAPSVRELVGSGIPILTITFIKDTLLLKTDPSNYQPFLLDSLSNVGVQRIQDQVSSKRVERSGNSAHQKKHQLPKAHNNDNNKNVPSSQENHVIYSQKPSFTLLARTPVEKNARSLRTFRMSAESGKRKHEHLSNALEKQPSIIDFFPKIRKDFEVDSKQSPEDRSEVQLIKEMHNDTGRQKLSLSAEQVKEKGVEKRVKKEQSRSQFYNYESASYKSDRSGGISDRSEVYSAKSAWHRDMSKDYRCANTPHKTSPMEKAENLGHGDLYQRHEKTGIYSSAQECHQESLNTAVQPYTSGTKRGENKTSESHLSKTRYLGTPEYSFSPNKELQVSVVRLEEWYTPEKLRNVPPPTKTSALCTNNQNLPRPSSSLLVTRTVNKKVVKAGILNFVRKSKVLDNVYCGNFYYLPKSEISPQSNCEVGDDQSDGEHNNNSYIRELTIRETAPYESSLDHDNFGKASSNSREECRPIIAQGLDSLWLWITAFTYPPPHLMGQLLKNLILETKMSLIHYQALGLVHQVLMLHPPSNPAMKKYYLMVLESAKEDRRGSYHAWSFVRDVLSVMQQYTDLESENESLCGSVVDQPPVISMEYALDVLQFLVLLFRADLKHFTSGDGARQLLTWRVFLGHAQHLSNATPPVKQLFQMWVCMLSASPPVRQCLSQLVCILLEMAWKFSSTPLLPTTPLPHSLSAIGKELFICLKDTGPSVVTQLMRELPSPWVKNIVSSIIFQEMIQSTNIQIFLRDIIDFFYMVNIHRRANSSQYQKSTSAAPTQTTKDNRSLVGKKMRVGQHNINKQNHKGETALMRACIANKVDRVHLLLSVPGVNINLGDHVGWTALHEAAIRGHNDVIKCLLNFNCYDTLRTTDALYSCIKRDYYAKTVNARSRGGDDKRTPLHDAVENNHINTAKLLLEYSGKVLLEDKDREGRTALDLARTQEMHKLLHLYNDSNPSADSCIQVCKPLVITASLNTSTGILQSQDDRNAFAVSFANSYMESCGYRSVIYYIKKEQKKKDRISSSPSVRKNLNGVKNSFDSAKNCREECVNFCVTAEAKKSSNENHLVTNSQTDDVISKSEEDLVNQMYEYFIQDMKTHRELIETRSVTQDMGEVGKNLQNLLL